MYLCICPLLIQNFSILFSYLSFTGSCQQDLAQDVCWSLTSTSTSGTTSSRRNTDTPSLVSNIPVCVGVGLWVEAHRGHTPPPPGFRSLYELLRCSILFVDLFCAMLTSQPGRKCVLILGNHVAVYQKSGFFIFSQEGICDSQRNIYL